MSKKNRSKNQVSKSNVHMDREALGIPAAIEQPQDEQTQVDTTLQQIEATMDRNYMDCGIACARLFRAMVDAAVILPNMELYTTHMTLDNNRDCLTVTLHRKRLERGLTDGSEGEAGPENDGKQTGSVKHAYDSECKDCIDCEGCTGCTGSDICPDCDGCPGCDGPGQDHDDDNDCPDVWGEEYEEEHLHEY